MTSRVGKEDRSAEYVKVGTIRPSQVTHTFGPGAIVELPYMSVIVPGLDTGGLDPWQMERPGRTVVVDEERLLREVRRDLGPQVTALRTAPWLQPAPNNRISEADWAGLWTMPFPRWLRCNSCYALSRVDGGLFEVEVKPYRLEDAGWWHTRCPRRKGKQSRALPVRFVVACRNGHLDDFPWPEWAHKGVGYVCPVKPGEERRHLKLLDSGYAQRSTSQKVRCSACGAEATLTEAFGRDGAEKLPLCPGGRPHLNDYEGNGCGLDMRALLVGASNLWFAVRRSALAIPHQPRGVETAVAEHWTDLETFTDLADMKTKAAVLSTMPSGVWLSPDAPYALEELWDEYVAQRDGFANEDVGVDALLGPEWVALTTRGGTRHGDDFAVSDAGPPTTEFKDLFDDVYLATRLREVVAITGFTRLDAYDPVEEGPGRVRRASLSSAKTTWAPAVQSRGEGILVTLDEGSVQDWESGLRALEKGRHHAMRDAHRSWRARRGLDADVAIVSPRFVLLHTFSHMLIKAISVSSGYAAASIRERLYCREPDGGDPMAGVLFYTAASDSEGTMGGLVSLGDPETFGPLIDQAVDQARICSSDPFCATHLPNGSPGGEVGDGTLHGAACHVCLFLPETSCDHANRYLDRSFVVATLIDGNVAYLP